MTVWCGSRRSSASSLGGMCFVVGVVDDRRRCRCWLALVNRCRSSGCPGPEVDVCFGRIRDCAKNAVLSSDPRNDWMIVLPEPHQAVASCRGVEAGRGRLRCTPVPRYPSQGTYLCGLGREPQTPLNICVPCTAHYSHPFHTTNRRHVMVSG